MTVLQKLPDLISAVRRHWQTPRKLKIAVTSDWSIKEPLSLMLSMLDPDGNERWYSLQTCVRAQTIPDSWILPALNFSRVAAEDYEVAYEELVRGMNVTLSRAQLTVVLAADTELLAAIAASPPMAKKGKRPELTTDEIGRLPLRVTVDIPVLSYQSLSDEIPWNLVLDDRLIREIHADVFPKQGGFRQFF